MLALEGVALPAHLLEAAVAHATGEVPLAAPGDLAGNVRESLVGQEFAVADEIVVLDRSRPVGLVPINRLLAARKDETIAAIMDSDPPVVAPDRDQEAVAWKMVEHGDSGVAVVGGDGQFVGLVSARRMLGVVLQEHDEDLARLGGYVRGARGARAAAEEPVGQRLKHRLPWLIIGLVGAMLSAVVVGAFEAQLSEVLLLTFFLPAVIYLADAVGTQTEAVLIRGLAVGIRMRQVFWREMVSGALIGALIALAFFPFALIGWGNEQVALAVALALFCACAIASLVAMLLPLAFQRAGVDPAFGAGPLATVIQDLMSIVVYLAIAAPIAT